MDDIVATNLTSETDTRQFRARANSSPAYGAGRGLYHEKFPDYAYGKLPEPDFVRLLYILKYDLNVDTFLARLIPVRLSDLKDTPFCALSYTWGPSIIELWDQSHWELESVIQRRTLVLLDDDADTWPRPETSHDDGVTGLEEIYSRGSLFNLPISDSLGEFLSALVDQFAQGHIEALPLLWIDAVCINQSDLVEKAQQVDVMGSIYTAASRTIIWLGPQTSEVVLFRWFHKTFWPALKEKLDMYEYSPTKALMARTGELLARIVVPSIFAETLEWSIGALSRKDPLDPKTWHGIMDEDSDRKEWELRWTSYFEFFAKRSWFTRCWVVQEAVLSKNADIAIGSVWDISWDEVGQFSDLVRCLDIKNAILGSAEAANMSYLLDPIFSNQAPYGPSDIYALKEVVASPPYFPSYASAIWKTKIWPMMMVVRRRQATLYVDQIFSVVAMAKRVAPMDLKEFVIDYNSTPEAIFLRFAELAVRKTGTLFLLSYVEDNLDRQHGEASLPSWVPDFSNSLWGFPIQHPSMLTQIKSVENEYCHPRVDDAKLNVRGICLGKLSLMTWHPRKLDVCHSLSTSLIILKWVSGFYAPTSQEAIEAVARTWALWINTSYNREQILRGFRYCVLEGMAHRLWSAQGLREVEQEPPERAQWVENVRKDTDSIPLSREYWPTWDEVCARTEELRAELNRSIDHFDASAPVTKSVDAAIVMRYYNAVKAGTGNRKMFLTFGSGLLGICPWSSRVSDELWLLEGGDVPYALRPNQDGTYMFIGACYVHGGMDGELATDYLPSELREIVIA